MQKQRNYVLSITLCAVLIALSFVLSEVKIMQMPYGGSITLFSMLFATLAGYFCGIRWGLAASIALGFLNMIIDPQLYYPMQIVLDYILAFGCLGLSGLFSSEKHDKYGLPLGYLVAITGRFLCSFASGFIFFGEYAPEGMNPVVYSFFYNIFYIGGEGILTLIILSLPVIKNNLLKLKQEMVK